MKSNVFLDKDYQGKSNFDNYQYEFEVNQQFFSKARILHANFLRSDLSRFIIIDYNPAEFYIKYSIEDILVAATDDLLRYCTYHEISKEQATFTRSSGEKHSVDVFSIAESVRASVLTKWILKFRPCIAAIKSPSYKMIDNLSQTQSKEKFVQTELAIKRVQFCNEYLALICASYILNLPTQSTSDFMFILDLFSDEEQEKILYSLRYRMNHQDVFNLFYTVLDHQYSKD